MIVGFIEAFGTSRQSGICCFANYTIEARLNTRAGKGEAKGEHTNNSFLTIEME